MSRMGNLPVEIPGKVEVNFKDDVLTVKGPKGELTQKIDPRFDIDLNEDRVIVERPTDEREDRSQHGLYRSLINGMVQGVTEGFEKKLEMVGVGYSAQVKGGKLELEVGFSHPVTIDAPGEIEFEVENGTNITVKGVDKQLVGDIAARIRSVREPEPYKGKGIKYVGEHIRRKVGKTG